MQFDPQTNVPTNDDEAKSCLLFGKDPFIAQNMIGIYTCRRGLGATVLEAYEAALVAYLDAVQASGRTA